jgi:hypothetical protein
VRGVEFVDPETMRQRQQRGEFPLGEELHAVPAFFLEAVVKAVFVKVQLD